MFVLLANNTLSNMGYCYCDHILRAYYLHWSCTDNVFREKLFRHYSFQILSFPKKLPHAWSSDFLNFYLVQHEMKPFSLNKSNEPNFLRRICLNYLKLRLLIHTTARIITTLFGMLTTRKWVIRHKWTIFTSNELCGSLKKDIFT